MNDEKKYEKGSSMAKRVSLELKAEKGLQKTVYTNILEIEWNMYICICVFILNPTAPLLFLLPLNWLLLLWAWTEPGMKTLLTLFIEFTSTGSPIRRWQWLGPSAVRVWWNQMKSVCRSQPQSFSSSFFNHSSVHEDKMQKQNVLTVWFTGCTPLGHKSYQTQDKTCMHTKHPLGPWPSFKFVSGLIPYPVVYSTPDETSQVYFFWPQSQVCLRGLCNVYRRQRPLSWQLWLSAS